MGKVKDGKLAPEGKLKIEWAESRMPVLMGIRERFSAEKPLKGMRIALVCNLKPAKIFGNMSNGMLLAAEKDGKLALLTTDREIPNGAKIT